MPHKYYNAINCLFKNYERLAKIWQQHGSWTEAWQYLKKTNQIPKNLDPEKEWQKLLKKDVRLLLADDEQFPAPLRHIPLAPFGIYIRGNFIFSNNSVAVVGTRKATTEGRRTSSQFAKSLAQTGLVVVSGLALGVDQFAHQGALEPSNGKTIGVLANGLDYIYPPSNTNLAEKMIARGGALISEYALGTPSYPMNFLERNRIVSGLSRGVLVIEAPEKSGSLNTARFAVEQNREVFVVPGPINHPNYKGSHKLIQEGAALVTCPDDILQALGFLITEKNINKENWELTTEQLSVLNYIEQSNSLPVDKIVELTKLNLRVVNQALAFLVLKGIVKENGGQYSL